MRVFVILPRIPYPLEKGDKLRAFYQIKELSKDNEIILCALNSVKNINRQKAFEALQPYCRSVNFINLSVAGQLWNILLAFFKGLPLQVGFFYSRKAQRKINKLIDEYKPDHLYCQLVRTAEYVKTKKLPKTLDYQDVFSYGVKRRSRQAPLWLKPLLKIEYTRLIHYERAVFDSFDNKTIISEPDRNLIPHPKKEEIHIVRNGVDFEFFIPMEAEKKFDVVFTGNMHYPPNVDAARFLVKEIMPRVWQRKPGTKILLAGASPDAAVKALAGKQVVVSGWIDDIREAYASAELFIAPMRIGTGLQNKLLEAMSMKIPCITTPLANEALQAEPDHEILVAETAEELAMHLIHLIDHVSLRKKIAENGHLFAIGKFSWESATAPLNQLIHSTNQSQDSLSKPRR